MAVKAFSFGGGVQSVAALVLASQGLIDYKTFVFSNVGDDTEYPETMRYFREVAIPFAEAHGLNLIEIKKLKRDGSFESIYEKLHRTQRSIDIPVRMQNGAPGRRACTADYKIKPVAKWMKLHGATVEDRGTVGVGISLDEFERMKDSQIPYIINDYPLVDLRITREDCERLIAEAGIPVPPKSSCFFCPFHRPQAWAEMRHEQPDLFEKSVALERMINERRATLGLDDVWLTRFARPLDEAIPAWEQLMSDRADEKADKVARTMPNGQVLPKGYRPLTLFDPADDGQHNCGAFTCSGGTSAA